MGFNILFVNPPNTTSFHLTDPGTYVDDNVGNQFFILPRIPFRVLTPFSEVGEGEISLLDFEWYKNPELTKEDLISSIIDKKPKFLATTLIAQSNADSIDWLTTEVKKHLPSTKIIVGGQGVSILEERVLEYAPNIDIACTTNSDTTFPEIVKRLSRGLRLDDLEGIIYKENRILIKNPIRNKPEASFTPEIMYNRYSSLINNVINEVQNKGGFVLGLLENFKGCPFPCSFCAAKKPVSEKNLDTTLTELNYLFNIGVHKFYFIDLTFGLSRNKTEDLLSRLKEFKSKNREFGFRCVTRADRINDEFVKNLEESGCYEVGIGVETNDDTTLTSMSKKSTERCNTQALELLGRSGMQFKLFLIESYPGSTTETSKRTFELLDRLEDKGYRYFIQPALSRDIIPTLPGFKIREADGRLKRGTMSQLDFRHDGRIYGWDTDKAIRSTIYLMLAYPSTEISKEHYDKDLQKRILMDLPFLVSYSSFHHVIRNIKESENPEVKLDIVHFLNGVYTPSEISDKVSKLNPYLPEKEIRTEVDSLINKLRAEGFLDSLGNPNLSIQSATPTINAYELNITPRISPEILLFWNGINQRYAYLPNKACRIKSSLYQDIPEDAFNFLFLAKGYYNLDKISEKMFRLFKGNLGYLSRRDAQTTTQSIQSKWQEYGFLVT